MDINKVNETTGTIDKIMQLYNKYGFKSILKGVLSTIVISYLIFFALNPTWVYDKWKQREDETHKVEIAKRFEVSEQINNELECIKNKLGADRVFIIEFHNSVKSLNGYPFAYGSMNFETCKDGVYYVSDEYADFNLSKYKLISYIYNNTTFFGSVEDVKDIDNRLYLKFLSNDVKEIGLISIEGIDSPNGILGISFTTDDDNRDWNRIKGTLRQEAVRIGLIFNR